MPVFVIEQFSPMQGTRQFVRCALCVVAAVSGAVIALRSLFGPLTFPVKVTKPVNPEDWFALALVLTMLVTDDVAKNTSRKSRATI
jgi:hypothetical protein